MNLEPLNDYLILKPANDEKSEGGIFMPGAENQPLQKGKVLACSVLIDSGRSYNPDSRKVRVGDIVYYFASSSYDLNYKGEKCLVLRVADLIAKELSEDSDA